MLRVRGERFSDDIASHALLLLAGRMFCCCWHPGLRLSHRGQAVRLPTDLHTLYVPTFINGTSIYRIEQTITEDVIRELRSRTNYRIVTTNDGDADATLNGTVTAAIITSADLRPRDRAHLLGHGDGHDEGIAENQQGQGPLGESQLSLPRAVSGLAGRSQFFRGRGARPCGRIANSFASRW